MNEKQIVQGLNSKILAAKAFGVDIESDVELAILQKSNDVNGDTD